MYQVCFIARAASRRIFFLHIVYIQYRCVKDKKVKLRALVALTTFFTLSFFLYARRYSFIIPPPPPLHTDYMYQWSFRNHIVSKSNIWNILLGWNFLFLHILDILLIMSNLLYDVIISRKCYSYKIWLINERPRGHIAHRGLSLFSFTDLKQSSKN